jgi:hypothetical protein
VGKFSARAEKFVKIIFSGIMEIGYEKISFSVLKEDEMITATGNKMQKLTKIRMIYMKIFPMIIPGDIFLYDMIAYPLFL